jgi:hypothetical protein
MQEGVEEMKENITTIVLTFIILIQMIFNFMTVRYCFTGLWSQQMTVNAALDTISVVQNSIQDKHILPEMLKGDWYTWFTDDGYLVFKIGPLKGRSF